MNVGDDRSWTLEMAGHERWGWQVKDVGDGRSWQYHS